MPKVTETSVKNVMPTLPKDQTREQRKQMQTKRVSGGGYDDAYVKAFTEHPELGKTAALIAAGYVGKYATQEAYRVHNRLRERIEAVLDEKILDGAHVGFETLLKLTKEAESESVKAQCAQKLMDYAGRKAADKLIVKSEKTDEELDQEIAAIQREIAEQSGRHLDS